MLQKINTLPLLGLPSASRIQPSHKGCLQVLCQRLASFGFSAKHLDTAVSGIRVIILVNAEKNAVFRFVYEFHPIFQVGNLLLGDGLSGGVHGYILPANELGVIAQQVKYILQPQGNLQIIAAFQPTCTGGSPAVLTAMARVNDNTVPFLPGQALR